MDFPNSHRRRYQISSSLQIPRRIRRLVGTEDLYPIQIHSSMYLHPLQQSRIVGNLFTTLSPYSHLRRRSGTGRISVRIRCGGIHDLRRIDLGIKISIPGYRFDYWNATDESSIQ